MFTTDCNLVPCHFLTFPSAAQLNFSSLNFPTTCETCPFFVTLVTNTSEIRQVWVMLCSAVPSNCLSCILFDLKTHKGNVFLLSTRSATVFLNWSRPFDLVSCSSVMPRNCFLSARQRALWRMSSLSGFCGLKVQHRALLQPEIRHGRKGKCWKYLC